MSCRFDTTFSRKYKLAILCAIGLVLAMVARSSLAQTAELDPLRAAVLQSIAHPTNKIPGSKVFRAALTQFYKDPRNEFLWLQDGRIGARAQEFIEVLRRAHDDVLDPDDYATELLARQLDASSTSELAQLEAGISTALLSYTRHISAGRVHPQRVNPELSIDPESPHPLAVLRGFRPGINVADYATRSFEPQTPRYARLREALRHYRQLANTGGWPRVAEGPTLKPGMQDPLQVSTLRHRLLVSGDLEANTHFGDIYDGTLVKAVEQFQSRHGLSVDGAVGPNTRGELNVSIAERVRQLELNMERRRWMEDDLGDLYVFVNLADQYLKVVERRGDREKTIHTALTVVGKTYHRTPVFSRPMTYIVVNPSWNVPWSIAVNEFLPKLQRNPGVLDDGNFRLVGANQDVDPYSIDWHNVTRKSFRWRLQQRPGEKNALGEVKFMFPNSFNVYIHDTPSKHLFSRSQRAFSHGCVRVQNPFDLAEVLLQRQGYTRSKIEQIRSNRSERVINLKKAVPVHISYLTAWVNKDGSVHFRRDVYGRDEILDKALRDAHPRAI